MLRFAYPFADGIAAALALEFDGGRLTHFLAAGYFGPDKVPDGDWKSIARASVEETDHGPVLRGYLLASVFRHGRSVTAMEAIRFGEPSETFTADFMAFLPHLFEAHGMNRVSWTVCVGNPAQRAYDAAIERYGGRVVGRMRECSILVDGSLCDDILYEIHADDYAAARSARG